MATTVVAPSSFGQAQSDLGVDYVFAAEAIRQELTEKLDVLNMGLMDATGEFTAQGTKTIRLTRFGGLGFAERMTAMGSETEAVEATGHTTAFDTLSVGRYALGKEATYESSIFNRGQALGLADMERLAPNSWLATLRYRMCVAGAAFSGSVGTSGAAWTYDDELDLVAFFHETEGMDNRQVNSVRHPEQFTDLAHSLRNEPAFQGSALLPQLLSLKPGSEGIDVVGINSFKSHDVQVSGGDHQGFAYASGAIVWGAPSTQPVPLPAGTDAIYVPQFGMLIVRKTDGTVATNRFDVNAWFGVDTVDASLAPATKIVSVND